MSVSSSVDAVWGLDNDALLMRLGVSKIGTIDAEETMISFSRLESIALEKDVNSAKIDLDGWLLEKGKLLFEETWNSIKDAVCNIHSEGLNVSGDLDLVKYIATAIISVMKLSNALVVLVVTIAVKQGLENLCSS